MHTVFIFHGTNGFPQENWFDWLKQKLEKLNCKVIVPQFPTPQNQTPESWFKVLEQYSDELNEDSILVGHSLGGTFLLRVLETIDFKIRGAFIVSATVGIKPLKNFETDKPFTQKPFEWKKIRQNCKNFFVFHSENDPIVGFANGEKIAKMLSTKLISVPDARHFNTAAEYTKFDLLLEKIKTVL